ncbi:uncharacterized protein LOC133903865 [Phragmites australis]|uniref:uncharacterized protein LOC133903865 n=1 Tax=Phragmites australis TaxID=29695 RepID=UPI002D776C4D|nr:uncharacterized protein LOC133903865 [Phragmites australis]
MANFDLNSSPSDSNEIVDYPVIDLQYDLELAASDEEGGSGVHGRDRRCQRTLGLAGRGRAGQASLGVAGIGRAGRGVTGLRNSRLGFAGRGVTTTSAFIGRGVTTTSAFTGRGQASLRVVGGGQEGTGHEHEEVGEGGIGDNCLGRRWQHRLGLAGRRHAGRGFVCRVDNRLEVAVHGRVGHGSTRTSGLVGRGLEGIEGVVGLAGGGLEDNHDGQEEEHAQMDEDGDESVSARPETNQCDNVIRSKQHTDEDKRAIYAILLHRTSFGILKHRVTAAVAAETGVPLRTVQRIWKNGKDGGVLGVVSKKPNNCGRKRIAFDPEAIKGISLHKRTTLKDMACEMHMSKTTLFTRLKEGRFRRHTNAIKFTLTAENKKARVRFCLNMLDHTSLPHQPTFQGMYNIIYIDEKWFYRTKQTQTYYLALDEEDPERTTQSKNFIEKVMFLAAVARPRYDMDGNMTFDGKIGIFPFTFVEPARRSSANRPRGTLVTKVLPSVTKDVSRDYIVNKLLPAIKEKWPVEEHGTPIFIQQDNAKTHIAVDDPEFIHAASSDGFDIRLMCQPPNSPDVNILDLGFFAALQALFHKSSPCGVEDIVAKVLQAFDEYPVESSNRIFLTHQSCMREILRLKGGQHYKVPHLRKQFLERHGELPIRLQCDSTIINEAMEFLS